MNKSNIYYYSLDKKQKMFAIFKKVGSNWIRIHTNHTSFVINFKTEHIYDYVENTDNHFSEVWDEKEYQKWLISQI
jgi:hypothetical protein